MLFYYHSIAWKLKNWAQNLAITCIVLCVIGVFVSLICFGTNIAKYNDNKKYLEYNTVGASIEYPTLYNAAQEALQAKQTANDCLSAIPALIVTACLSPIAFGGMYALGVIVSEIQANAAAQKKILELLEKKDNFTSFDTSSNITNGPEQNAGN